MAIAMLALLAVLAREAERAWHRVWGSLSGKRLAAFVLLEFAALTAVASVTALGWHGLKEGGLLAYPETTMRAAMACGQTRFPEVDSRYVDRLLASQGATIIDARYGDDFARGHLPGAINIPPSEKQGGRLAALASADRSALAVIYCQSDTCPFAGRLARGLTADGFLNLVIYKGGWRDWKAGHPDGARGTP
jgi:rhodanese-related sulfurtransferase